MCFEVALKYVHLWLPQASHDAHTIKLDSLEDRLVSTEVQNLNELAYKNAKWSSQRNRDRISEIINYVERNMMELEELAGDIDMGGWGGEWGA